jgi:hypothetical protein
MAVIGGATKSLVGRLAELGGWWPFLAALVAAGGFSAMTQMTGMETPGWAAMPMNLYHGMRDMTVSTTLGPNVDPKLADIAFAGIGIFSMAVRKVTGFAFSIGGFVAFAGIAWFLLKQFGQVPG